MLIINCYNLQEFNVYISSKQANDEEITPPSNIEVFIVSNSESNNPNVVRT